MAGIAAALLLPGTAGAAIIGSDASACTSRGEPSLLVNVVGLKDRKGEMKLELYPANEDDFLKDDRDLIKEGKFFRRVRTPTPQSGGVEMCIRAPSAGRYALLVTHNRDGKNKFSFWSDGAGFASGEKLGRSRPKVEQAIVDVGQGATPVTVRMQYLRGLGGFSPLGS
nr:DUF2141 domain-containing protein [Sphingomonas sp. EC-HK361]